MTTTVFTSGTVIESPWLNDVNTTVYTTVPSITGTTGAANVGYTPAGTSAVATTVQAKLRQYVSVKDFGAVGDGTTDDTAAIQAAVTASAGKKIYMPKGTYKVTSQIICPSGTWLYGDGAGETIISAVDNVSPLLFQDASVVEYTGAGISNLTVKGNGAAVRLVTVNEVWGFTAEHCRVYGSPGVLRCFEIQRYSFECQITSCRITDADESCIYLNEISGELPNGCWIQNCDFSPNASGYCVYDEAQTTRIIGNWFEFATLLGGTGVYSTGSPIIIGNNLSGGYNGTAAVNLVGTNNAIISNNKINVYGIAMQGVVVNGCTNTNITDNSWNVDAAQYCVILNNGCTNTNISSNNMRGVVGGAYGLTAIVLVGSGTQSTIVSDNIYSYSSTATGIGVQINNGATLVDISNNQFTNLVTAISCLTNASNPRVNIIDNWFVSCTTGVTYVNTLDVYLYNNQGFKTENRGYPATIPSGSNRVTVAHGLAVTPPTSGIRLILVDALGTGAGATTNNVQGPFVVSVNATNIVIGCGADPGASGMSFGWEVTFSI